MAANEAGGSAFGVLLMHVIAILVHLKMLNKIHFFEILYFVNTFVE